MVDKMVKMQPEIMWLDHNNRIQPENDIIEHKQQLRLI
jgi:hypothetical protein